MKWSKWKLKGILNNLWVSAFGENNVRVVGMRTGSISEIFSLFKLIEMRVTVTPMIRAFTLEIEDCFHPPVVEASSD